MRTCTQTPLPGGMAIVGVLLFFVVQAQAWSEEVNDASRTGYQTDAAGRAFRVSFDPGNMTVFRLGWGFSGEPDRWRNGTRSMTFGAAFRAPRAGQSDEESFWIRDTVVLSGELERLSFDGIVATPMRMALFSGSYVRYTRDPYVTLPSDPPRRIWFPFNTGFSAELLHLDTLAPAAGLAGELKVLSAHILLDFLRSERAATWGRIGVGIRYDLLFPESEGLALSSALSDFAPFTATSVTLHHESHDGLWLGDVRLELVPRWSRTYGWSTLTEGAVRLERIVLAVNDAPVAIFAGVSLRRDPALEDVSWGAALRCMAGVKLGFNR